MDLENTTAGDAKQIVRRNDGRHLFRAACALNAIVPVGRQHVDNALKQQEGKNAMTVGRCRRRELGDLNGREAERLLATGQICHFVSNSDKIDIVHACEHGERVPESRMDLLRDLGSGRKSCWLCQAESSPRVDHEPTGASALRERYCVRGKT
jgi:hypothetical protein